MMYASAEVRARGAPSEGRRGRRVDLRLVPAAAAVWAAMLLGLGGGPVAAGVATAGAAAAAVLAAFRCRGPGRSWWAAPVLAAAGCATAAGIVVGAHEVLVVHHPLRAVAERGAAASLRVELRDDPHPMRTPGYAGQAGQVTQLIVPAVVRAGQVGAAGWSAGGRVVLLAPVEGWSGLLPGQVVTAAGLLAPAAHNDLTVAVLRVRGPPRDVAPASWWQRGAGSLRTGLTDAARVLPAESAGLLPGLTVGDTAGLSPEVERDFRAAGLAHLLAVSGTNLAIVGGAVLGLLRLLRADPRLAAALSACAVLGFVVLARPSPSVLRAAVMAGVVLLALALGRNRSALPALAAAVLALLLADPALAVDPGFGLSVLATAALVLVAPGWADALRRRGVPRGVAEALSVPAAAYLATAPLVAGLSGEVSAIAVLANLVAVPAVAPATVLGVLAAVLAPIAVPAAQACAWLAGPAVGWLVAVADRAAGVPGAPLPWPAGVTGGVLLAVLVVVVQAPGPCAARGGRRRPRGRAGADPSGAAGMAAGRVGGGRVRRRAGRRRGPGDGATGVGGPRRRRSRRRAGRRVPRPARRRGLGAGGAQPPARRPRRRPRRRPAGAPGRCRRDRSLADAAVGARGRRPAGRGGRRAAGRAGGGPSTAVARAHRRRPRAAPPHAGRRP